MARHDRQTNSRFKACIAIICVLTLLLGGLSTYTIVTVGKMQGVISAMESKLAAEQANSSDYAAQLAEKDAIITEKENENADLKDENADLKGENAELKDENDDLKDENADLKVQIALKNTAPGDPNLPEHGEYDMYEGQKIVALTFDDGPGPYTAELLDFLKQEGVRVTFFVLGTRVDSYPKLIRRMAAEGHEIGNHSNAHNMLHHMDLVGVRKEMGKCAEKIEKLLGYRPSVMRCPGGNKNSAVEQYAKEAGIPIAYWSVDTLDWKSRDKDAILDIAFGKNGIRDGSIVLMHDIHKTTIPAAKEMIRRLKEEGYTFVTTTELIAARRGGIVPGKQYS
ncbi:MAG: polysaccharide deacetylase family protein [Clostridia bacterium]|nr:polysaccharide deacetylase family protein [Clostridia bacterium]